MIRQGLIASLGLSFAVPAMAAEIQPAVPSRIVACDAPAQPGDTQDIRCALA